MGLSEELEEVGAHGDGGVRKASGVSLEKSMKVPEAIFRPACSLHPQIPSKVSMLLPLSRSSGLLSLLNLERQ